MLWSTAKNLTHL